MMRAVVLGALLLLGSGCVSFKILPLHLTSEHRYDPADRQNVWGRALVAFQRRGLLITASDFVGGVLQSREQPSRVECHGLVGSEQTAYGRRQTIVCRSTEMSQFTLGAEGTAILRVNRVVSGHTYGNDSPLTPKDVALLQNECDDFLAFIVGTSTKAPEPLPLPPGAPKT